MDPAKQTLLNKCRGPSPHGSDPPCQLAELAASRAGMPTDRKPSWRLKLGESSLKYLLNHLHAAPNFMGSIGFK